MNKDKNHRRKRRQIIWTTLLVLLLIFVSRSCLYRENTKRQFIIDPQGRALVLRGFNVNGNAKGDSLRVGKTSKEDYLRMSADWGFNFARFLVFWQAIEPQPGVVDTAYLERVYEQLDWCYEAGLNVVLDMHQDLYTWKYGGDGAPEWAIWDDGEEFEMQSPWEKNYLQPAVIASIRNFWMPENGHGDLQEHYIASFVALAKYMKGHPALLGYDLYNEPVLATRELFKFEDRYLHPFYQNLIDSLRQADPNTWLFYEPMAIGPNQGGRSGLGQLEDPRDGEARLAYFPHIYTLDLDLSGKYIGFPLFTSAWAAKRNRETTRHGAPMLIGEFGLDNSMPKALDYLEAVMRMSEKTGSGWAYWDFGKGGNWAPIRKDESEKPMLDVLVRPYPQRTAGTPVSYGFNPEKQHFWLHWKADPGILDSTVIFIPKRVYPQGWEFGQEAPEESSWRWDQEAGKLYIAPSEETGLQKVEIIPRAAARVRN